MSTAQPSVTGHPAPHVSFGGAGSGQTLTNGFHQFYLSAFDGCNYAGYSITYSCNMPCTGTAGGVNLGTFKQGQKVKHYFKNDFDEPQDLNVDDLIFTISAASPSPWPVWLILNNENYWMIGVTELTTPGVTETLVIQIQATDAFGLTCFTDYTITIEPEYDLVVET